MSCLFGHQRIVERQADGSIQWRCFLCLRELGVSRYPASATYTKRLSEARRILTLKKWWRIVRAA